MMSRGFEVFTVSGVASRSGRMGNHGFLLKGFSYFLLLFLTLKFPLCILESFVLHQKFRYGLITMANMYQWIRFVYVADSVEQNVLFFSHKIWAIYIYLFACLFILFPTHY